MAAGEEFFRMVEVTPVVLDEEDEFMVVGEGLPMGFDADA